MVAVAATDAGVRTGVIATAGWVVLLASAGLTVAWLRSLYR